MVDRRRDRGWLDGTEKREDAELRRIYTTLHTQKHKESNGRIDGDDDTVTGHRQGGTDRDGGDVHVNVNLGQSQFGARKQIDEVPAQTNGESEGGAMGCLIVAGFCSMLCCVSAHTLYLRVYI